jgi:hypothetical protein
MHAFVVAIDPYPERTGTGRTGKITHIFFDSKADRSVAARAGPGVFGFRVSGFGRGNGGKLVILWFIGTVYVLL